jgi:hypothetical protein
MDVGKRFTGRGGRILVVLLAVVALGVAALVAGPWAVAVWGGGVAVAIGAEVVKNVFTRRVETVLTTGSPLTVTVRLDTGNYVRIPGEIGSQVVPRSGHAVDITVETSSPQAVILRRMEPVVVSREPVLEARPIIHRGMMPVRRYQVWLSEDPPRLVAEGADEFPYKVTADDPEMFAVTAHVTNEHVRWRLELHWTRSGREGVVPIDIDGEPFVTVGLADD